MSSRVWTEVTGRMRRGHRRGSSFSHAKLGMPVRRALERTGRPLDGLEIKIGEGF